MASSSLSTALASVKSRFIAENPVSEALHTGRLQHLPNGNTRTTLHYYPFPVCFKSGNGCFLTSVDGKEYIDFLGEYTAGIFGHSHPVILEALRNALLGGIGFGGVNELEGQLAQKMCETFGLGKVRFTNSATEANIMALAAAKHFTGRKKILVFARGYHGGTLGFPDGRPGPFNIPHEWVVAPYNDISATSDILLSLPADSLAAILIEPMQGAAGCFPASEAFLQYLRSTATSCGAVLIFDEVMTSRLHWGGLQAKLAIKPDMTTFGKYLAGGMSFGAFGGTDEIMQLFATIPHAGTFNNNIMSMTGGVAAFSILTPEVLGSMNELGDSMRAGIDGILQPTNGGITITGVGSLMSLHFGTEQVRELFFFYMLVEEGVYLAARGFMALTIVHEARHVAEMLQAVKRFVQRYSDVWV